MLKVGIKYCGGCNPDYDRVAFFKSIEKRLRGQAQFVSPEETDVDLILAVEGCRTACADLSSFDDIEIRIINQIGGADDLVQEIMGQWKARLS